MPNTAAWDKVPVHAWYYKSPGVPDTGTVQFKLEGAPTGVKRLDGTAIYRAGATLSVTVGDPMQQDAQLLAALKTAYKARAQAAATAAGQAFNGTAWDAAWAASLPAMVCTGFYAQDDPEITPKTWQVTVTERLSGGPVGPYPIPLTVAMIDSPPIPGLNLTDIEIPPGTAFVPAPTYAKGQPGGVAALDADGDVVDATGAKVIASGATATWTTLSEKPSTFPPSTHTHTASQISDSTTVGRALMTAVDAAAARAAIGAGTGSGTGSVASTDITDSTATGRSVLTAASAAAARTILGAGTSSLALGATSTTAKSGDYVPSWTEVTGKPTTFAPTIGTTSTTAKAGDYVPAWTEVTGKPSTFTPATHTHAATDVTGTLSLAQMPAGMPFTITWSGTAWRYNGANITARPTSRTDLTMIVIGGTTFPTFALTNDIQLRDPA